MASINKLSVRGVRSFSPTAEEQVLEFFFPVTIIVGANGCGKTTIIESLKFAVCGALPPGKNSGQSFVHDPRSVGTQQVKAQVKLRFTNRAGCSMVAVRSMELEKKKTKLTFKQLDGVLRVVDKEGNKQSLSHKCSELDKQIPSLLGVSAAILQHVVFCHQEDSSWPLQDASVVKKNFDAIFDSSRYTKALEVFAKLKRDYTSKVKDIKAEVEGYKAHKHAAKGFRKDLEHYNSQLENLEEEMSARKAELKENEEELNKIYAILEEVDAVNNSIQVKNSELGTEETIIQTSKKRLREDLTETKSIRELKDMLREFEEEIELQQSKHRDLKDEINDIKKNLSNVRQEREEMQTSIGRLQAANSAHENTLNQRYDQLMSIASTYGLADVLTPTQTQTQLSQSQTQLSSYNASSLGDTSFSEHQSPQERILDIPQADMDEYYRVLSKKENEMRENLSQIKAKYQEEEDRLQSALAEIMGKLNSIRNDEAKLEKEQKDARNELSQIAKELSGMSLSRLRKSDVEDAKRNAAEAAKKLESSGRDPRRTEIPSEIRSLDGKVDSLKRDLEDDRAALKLLRLSEETQNAIEVLKDQSNKELEELQESVNDVAFAFQQYNIDAPPELPSGTEDASGGDLTELVHKLVGDFSHKHEDLSREQIKAGDEVNRLQRLASEAKALLEHNNGSLRRKREAMRNLEDKVTNIQQVMEELRQFENDTPNDVDESKPQELLSYLDNKLREEESSSTEGIPPATVKKIMKKLLKQAPEGDNAYSCPCCKRSFDQDDDIRTFQKTLKLLGSENSPLLKLDERNKAARANYQRWKRIVSENANDVLEFRRLANETNDLEQSIEETGQSLQDKQKQLEEAQNDNTDLQEKVEEVRNYLETSKRWAEAASRIAEKRMQVNQKKTDLSMSQSFGDRDLKTVEKDVAEKSDLKDKYAEDISKLNKQLNLLNTQMTQLQVAASRTEKLAREKEKKFSELQKLHERKAILNETMSKCQTALEKMKEDIAPLRQKSRDKENEKKRMRSLGKEEEERLNSTLNDFSNAVHRLKEITRQIDEYKESNNEAELGRFTKKSEELSDKINQYNSRIQAKQPALETLEKAIGDQENHKMNLNENIDLINSRQKLEVTRKELEKLENSKMEIAGYDTCEADMNRLTKRKSDINSSISHLEGQRRGIVDNIRAQKRKLSQEEYRNVEEDYRVAMIKHETTQMAVRDLQRYHDALDKALLRYHRVKIAEINKIIRDLWTLTYKGEDITNIELVSGQDAGSRASRSYNYRVVMTKGNTQLDMRGRCSAGQRVLASIVVRLALAETFCVNFGCIALDEPTVNLDYQNKRGLAIALAQITASRSAQRNFQLIMITHDEDFVAMMKTELSTLTGFSMPEKYFQVKREEDHDGKFYSKIDAVDWDELL